MRFFPLHRPGCGTPAPRVSPTPRVSAHLRGRMLPWLLSIGLLSVATVDLGRAQSLYDPRDPGFEERMTAVDPSCMPAPFPVVTESYAYRLGTELADECVSQNQTDDQVLKYTALLMASVAPSPAAPFAATYAAGELSSDGLKCVAKAFVDASNDLTPAEKESRKSQITASFALKDWRSFAQGIPDIRSPEEAARTKAVVETALALYERGTEGRSLLRVIGAALEGGQKAASDYVFGEVENDLDASAYAAKSCRYSDAEKWFGEAKDAARAECRAYGLRYRQAEVSLRSHIFRNRAVLTGALTDPVQAANRNPAEDTYVNLYNVLQNRKESLERYSKTFAKLDEEEKELSRARADFRETQAEYRFQVRLVRRVMDTADVCVDIGKLSQISSAVKPECRPAFFADARPGEMATPDELGFELSMLARERSARWWATTDEIERDYQTCNIGDAQSKVQALRAEMATQPTSLVTGGLCQRVDQTALQKRIAGLVTPAYCLERPVPDVIGLDLATATNRLYEANLRPGKKTILVPPESGQTPGTVVDANPPVASMQRAYTEVTLTVAGAKPAEKQAIMPEVVGLEEAEAAGLVSGAGLVPAIVEGKPADRRERIPGTVYAAGAAKGSVLPVGAEVTLSIYGARPKVVIKAVAGLTVDEARALLTGQNFAVGDPVAGEPATGEHEPGEVYATDPPQGTEHEMFGDVRLLVYGAKSEDGEGETRPIPSVIGETVAGAKGALVAEDEFFSIGATYLGDPAPADKAPGTVYETTPGPGTRAIRGTRVDLLIYGPHEVAVPSDRDAAPPPVAREGGEEDGGWLGRWRVHGATSQGGKRQEFVGIMELATRDNGVWLNLFTEKSGQLKSTIALPVRIANAVVMVRTELLQQRQTDGGHAGAGVAAGATSEFAQIFRQILATLKISRDGSQCQLSYSDNNGPQVVPFECRREDGSPQ